MVWRATGKLGSDFEKHVIKAMISIVENPIKVQVRYNDIRVFFLKKFPFGIHYKVSGTIVLIVAVFHTSRNPDEWNERT